VLTAGSGHATGIRSYEWSIVASSLLTSAIISRRDIARPNLLLRRTVGHAGQPIIDGCLMPREVR
jgi:hypothetical protein